MRAASLADGLIGIAERGWVPDAAIRWGIERLCTARLREQQRKVEERGEEQVLGAFLEGLRRDELAPVPHKANQQHYEVPARLFQLMLGPRLKYSCCYWPDGITTLAGAEEASLALTAARAGVQDGQTILELGCGWGSLTLWIAERFRHSHIVGVSNSTRQRAFIEQEARRRGLGNVEITTADMNGFDTARRFDRVVSVEMFEHMRNYTALLQRIRGWLHADGVLFVHVFCHRRYAYRFEDAGASDWMARHFFSGGVMPSAGLLPSVPSELVLDHRWDWDGTHYQRTAEAWLRNLDDRRGEAIDVLRQHYGADAAMRWLGRWRIFLMACAQLFGHAGGTEWGVAHYRFVPAIAATSRVAGG